ncbi:MAG: aspartyl protease family protein [Proteobacteria bacterium]|nr:aspartyl protease family protein [Pseudomonadota bacterium]
MSRLRAQRSTDKRHARPCASGRAPRAAAAARRRALLAGGAAVFACALGLACGESAPVPTLRFEGEVGQRVPLQLVNGVPALAAVVDGGDAQLFLLDTGAPLTLLAQRAFPERPSGPQTLRLGAFGLAFPAAPAVMSALFASESACAGPTPAGVIGGDLLRQFGLELDLAGLQVALRAAEPAIDEGAAVSAPQVIPFRLRGGGTVHPTEDVSVQVGATRVIVPLRVEGVAVEALLDTGATTTLIRDGLLRRLPATGRPLICCERVETASQGALAARITRLRRTELGTLRLDGLAVLVLPDATPFAALSRETGRSIDLILGADVLRQLVSYLDYPARRWRVALRGDAVLAPADDFVLAGFTFCAARDGDGAIVQDVFVGSDAFAKGVRSGERLLSIGGEPVAGLDRAALLALLRRTPVGETVRLAFGTGSGISERVVRIEQHLPPLP